MLTSNSVVLVAHFLSLHDKTRVIHSSVGLKVQRNFQVEVSGAVFGQSES